MYHCPEKPKMLSYATAELLGKEWNTFKKLLLQKFPPRNMVSVSSVCFPSSNAVSSFLYGYTRIY